MLSLVGLGLGSPDDVTVRGREVIRRSDVLYLDACTALFPGCEQENMRELFGKPIRLADRSLIAEMLRCVKKDGQRVAFLVVGDLLCATTHTDLILRCRVKKIPTEVVHNASIMNAVSSCGLQLYRFGEAPESFFDKVEDNRKRGCHTLCLLNIQVKERSEEKMLKGRMDIFEPPRYMSIPQPLSQFSQIVDGRQEEHWLQQENNIVGIARLFASDECIRCGTVKELINAEFGPPLHALVIPADDLHECEQDYIDFY
ncbi:unnamed protein product, partial [Amoebophrya sp. A25]|eukprot:GSA25T00027813001.1